MKRLGVDLRCLPMDGRAGAGIPRAAREVWQACLVEAPNYGLELVGFIPVGATMPKEDGLVRLISDSSRALRQALQQYPIEALFVPSGAVPFGLRLPTFPWVHDVAIFEHPEWFRESWWQRQLTTRLFKHGLRQARHIFTVSQATTAEVAALLHRPISSITVTYEGVDNCDAVLSQSAPIKGTMPTLFLGTIEPRKNLPFLISLWPEVCRRLGQTVSLIVAGQTGWGQVRIDANVLGVNQIGEITDQERTTLLERARLVVVPSLYEGFGRVALEAMAAGAPVIVSRRGALPEVVGAAGIVLDLEDREAWIASIVRLYQDPAWWNELSQRGRVRARDFSWSETARRILARVALDC